MDKRQPRDFNVFYGRQQLGWPFFSFSFKRLPMILGTRFFVMILTCFTFHVFEYESISWKKYVFFGSNDKGRLFRGLSRPYKDSHLYLHRWWQVLSSLQVEPLGWQLCSRSLLPWVAFIDLPSWPFRYLSNSGPHIVKEFSFFGQFTERCFVQCPDQRCLCRSSAMPGVNPKW